MAPCGYDQSASAPGVLVVPKSTILIVDDEPSVRAFLKAALQRARMSVLEAEDGVAALKIMGARAREIGLVISDIEMPRMGGLELVSFLRQGLRRSADTFDFRP
jgi:CheY-like chemotaxis protein